MRVSQPFSWGRARRATALLAAVWAGLLVAVSAAQADDLLILNGDSITLSGSHSYGFVYVDGAMRLTGDTSISASSIYFGPNAYLATCFVAGVGDNGCTAGRSLTLSSSGRLVVSSGIDLTGGTGSPQPGGNLTLSGNPVTVGGGITTAGASGGASGHVSILSGGSLATGGIYAPSAQVNLGAQGAIDVAGDIDTYGTSGTPPTDPGRVESAAPVAVSSSGGDVRIEGNINSGGRNAPAAGALGGGNGAPVSITGNTVRTGAIDVTGGASAAGVGGSPATITLTARSALHALGRLDAGGEDSAAGSPTSGGRINLTASGPLSLAEAHVDGATGPGGGSPAGAIGISGADVTTGDLTAQGGNAPGGGSPPPAGAGGSLSVRSLGGASLGRLLAAGGNAYSGGLSGRGGSIDVEAGLGAISTAVVQTHAGYTSNGPGTDGGPITLSALGDLTVGGTLDATGSDANASVDPALSGGNAGSVFLRAAAGTLSLDGGALASGGGGSQNPTSGHLGGTGGQGARIDLVAHALGPISAISSAGGSGGGYGADQGPGGAGGPIYAWTDGPLFDSQKVVDSNGGDGNPTGAAGAQHQDSSPTGLTLLSPDGVLGFTSRSPDAPAYRLEQFVGGTPQPVLQTAATSGLRPRVPICVPVTFTVVAFDSGVGWTSNAAPALTFTRPPSATQRCQDPPRLTVPGSARASLRTLRRRGWQDSIAITTSGIGSVGAALETAGTPSGGGKRGRGHKPPAAKHTVLALYGMPLARTGGATLRLHLPATARRTGAYLLKLLTTSPDGSRHASSTLNLVIGR